VLQYRYTHTTQTMFYLVKCSQYPPDALKAYREVLAMCEEGAKIIDINARVRELRLLPGGLPWQVVYDENMRTEEHTYFQISTRLFSGDKLLVEDLLDALDGFESIYDRVHEHSLDKLSHYNLIEDFEGYTAIILSRVSREKDAKISKFKELEQYFCPEIDVDTQPEDLFCCDMQIPEMGDLLQLILKCNSAIDSETQAISFLERSLEFLIEHDELRNEVIEIYVKAKNALTDIDSQFEIIHRWQNIIREDDTDSEYYLINGSVELNFF
jgi:hypothetical protein